MSKHFALLYMSSMKINGLGDEVVSYLRPTRAQANRAGVTGALLFDGVMIVQYMEGSQQALMELLEATRSDSKIENLIVIHHAELPGPQRFHDWKVGFPKDTTIELYAAMKTLERESNPLEWFYNLVAQFDMM